MAATSEHITLKGAQTAGFAGLIDAAKFRFKRYWLYRQTYNELAGLTARELADLGLHRSMIRQVALQAANDAA